MDGTPTTNSLDAVLFRKLPIDQLKPNPWNRKVFSPEGIQSLAVTVKSRGIQEPLIVRPASDGQGYEIASGNRRYLAAQQAGLKEVPCLVQTFSDTDIQDKNILANMDREDTPPLELARMLKERMNAGSLTQDQVVALYGKSQQWSSELLGFLGLPQEVIENTTAVVLGIRGLRAIKGLSNKDLQVQVAQELKEGKIKPEQVEKRCNELNKKPKQKSSGVPKAGQMGIHITEAGPTLKITGFVIKSMTKEVIVTVFEEALEPWFEESQANAGPPTAHTGQPASETEEELDPEVAALIAKHKALGSLR